MLSFKGKIFSLFIFIILLSVSASYFSVNYFISTYIYESEVKNVNQQLNLLRDKVSGDIRNKVLLAQNLDTGSASLDELQESSGFFKIYKIIQGIVFSDNGTINDEQVKNSLLNLVAEAGQGVKVSNIQMIDNHAIITVTIAGAGGRANIFFINLDDISALLADASSDRIFLELSDPTGTQLFSSKIEGDLIEVPMQVDLAGQAWQLNAFINEDSIAADTSSINRSITIALIISGALIVALSIVSIIIAYRPITSLRDVVTDLASGEGDLTRRLAVNSKDELGQIAKAINQFTQSLQSIMLEILGSTKDLDKGMNEITQQTGQNQELLASHVRETEQAIAAITEMSATADSVAESALTAAQLTEQSSSDADTCKQQVNESVNTANALIEEVEHMSSTINTLNQDIGKIGGVLSVIGGIAEQTNLLALNAAIEAARAGEQGRGFAVVADEVRALADQTQKSTKEINEMLQRLQTGTSSVVAAMESTKDGCHKSANATANSTESLDAMSHSIGEIAALNTQIATAAEQQSVVTNEITRNMVSIQEMVMNLEQNGNTINQSVADLSTTKGQLTKVVEHFKLA
ncbi:methyl-accepting chemotaxis protein [Agarivorans sp. MS3-6]